MLRSRYLRLEFTSLLIIASGLLARFAFRVMRPACAGRQSKLKTQNKHFSATLRWVQPCKFMLGNMHPAQLQPATAIVHEHNVSLRNEDDEQIGQQCLGMLVSGSNPYIFLYPHTIAMITDSIFISGTIRSTTSPKPKALHLKLSDFQHHAQFLTSVTSQLPLLQ